MTEVAGLREAAQQTPAYGNAQALRKQYAVRRISRMGLLKAELTIKRLRTTKQELALRQELVGAPPAANPQEAAPAEAGKARPRAGKWYYTQRMRLIHKKAEGDEWLPACAQRQSKQRQRPAQEADVLWSGSSAEARGMGRKFCEAAECAWCE